MIYVINCRERGGGEREGGRKGEKRGERGE